MYILKEEYGKSIKRFLVVIWCLLFSFSANLTYGEESTHRRKCLPHGSMNIVNTNKNDSSSADISQVSADGSDSWMTSLPDDMRIIDLNIPGTHDAGTARVTAFTWDWAQCQDWTITEQLNNGIRYLDLRVSGDGLINHGGVACWRSTFKHLFLDHVVDYVDSFLKSHPGETVFLQVKSEGRKGNAAGAINRFTNRDHLYRGNKNLNELNLGDVRGKFVLFSRQSGVNNAYHCSWTDNPVLADITVGDYPGKLQDKYESNTSKKWSAINQYYNTLGEDNKSDDCLFISFTSFANTPRLNARNLKKRGLNDFINNNDSKKLGVLLQDFPDRDSVRAIYSSNANRYKVLAKAKAEAEAKAKAEAEAKAKARAKASEEYRLKRARERSLGRDITLDLGEEYHEIIGGK